MLLMLQALLIFFAAKRLSTKLSIRHTISREFALTANLNNWIFGGSCALTDKYASLNPGRPYSKGWVASNNPIPGNAFEVFVEFKVSGSGANNPQASEKFAITILESGVEGSVFKNEINQSKFLLSKKRGISVVVDTSSPKGTNFASVYVIDNMNSEDLDRMPDNQLEHKKTKNFKRRSTCRFQALNGAKPSFIRVQVSENDILVKVDNNFGKKKNMKELFCLDSKISRKFNDGPLIAVSSESGANGHQHTVRSIKTFYSKSVTGINRAKDDELIKKLKVVIPQARGNGPFYSKARRTFWVCAVLSSMFLVLGNVWQMIHLNELSPERINSVKSIDAINLMLPFYYGTQASLIVIFFLKLQFFTFFWLLIPPLLHVRKLKNRSYLLLSKDFEEPGSKLWYYVKLYTSLGIHSAFALFSISTLISF